MLALALPIAFSLIQAGIWFERSAPRLWLYWEQKEQQRRARDRSAAEAYSPQREHYWFRKLHRHEPIVAEPQNPESQHRQAEQEFWSRTLREQRNLNIFTFLGVAAAFAAFLVLRSTLNEAQTQAQIAQTQLKLSERPWVGIATAQVTTPLSYEQTMVVRVCIVSLGPTPALNVNNVTALVPGPIVSSGGNTTADQVGCTSRRKMEESVRAFAQGPVNFIGQSNTVLFPHSTECANVLAMIAPVSQEPKNKALIDDILSGRGRQALYLAGCIEYGDSLNVPHWTEFCQYYSPQDNQFYLCPTNNSADRNYEAEK
jgi:hypothetical protein